MIEKTFLYLTFIKEFLEVLYIWGYTRHPVDANFSNTWKNSQKYSTLVHTE